MRFDPEQLDQWCQTWLGSGIAESLFSAAHLSTVEGVRLADGREVVIKIRAASPRLEGCTYVQRHLWQAGFPCPEPLVGPVPMGELAVNAEVYVGPGEELGQDSASAGAFAELLARLIRLAPDPAGTPSLGDPPPWMHWSHRLGAVWPPPDDRDADLNAHPETAWLDEIGRGVRDRLGAVRGARRVIGHCDFESQNVQWRDGKPWAVHDWDSVVYELEAVIVGQAAAMWPAGALAYSASVQQGWEFLDAYQHSSGRVWSTDEVQASWAAGLWVLSFNAKKSSLDGEDLLDRDEAQVRMNLAGIAGRAD